MDKTNLSDEDSDLRRAAAAGLVAFAVLYPAIFIAAAAAGMSMEAWLSVLGSGDILAFALFTEAIPSRAAFAWVFVLQILSATGFGIGFTSLLASWSRKPRARRALPLIHAVMACFAALTALLDLAGTIPLLATLGLGRPMPLWAAPFSTALYYARLPLCYIVLLWVAINGILFIAKRFRSRCGKRRGEANPVANSERTDAGISQKTLT